MTKTVAGVALFLIACASSASASVIIQKHRPHIAPIAPAAAAAGGDVSIDTVTSANTTNSQVIISHTFGASANGVCVLLMQQDGAPVTAAPTLTGATFTKAVETSSNESYVNGQAWCSTYSGGAGAQNVTIDQPDAQKLTAAVISLNNVNQTTPTRATGTVSDISTSVNNVSTAAHTTASGGMILTLGGAAGLSAPALTVGAGETVRATRAHASALHTVFASEPSDSGGGSVTVSITASDNDRLSMAFVEIRKQ